MKQALWDLLRKKHHHIMVAVFWIFTTKRASFQAHYLNLLLSPSSVGLYRDGTSVCEQRAVTRLPPQVTPCSTGLVRLSACVIGGEVGISRQMPREAPVITCTGIMGAGNNRGKWGPWES